MQSSAPEDVAARIEHHNPVQFGILTFSAATGGVKAICQPLDQRICAIVDDHHNLGRGGGASTKGPGRQEFRESELRTFCATRVLRHSVYAVGKYPVALQTDLRRTAAIGCLRRRLGAPHGNDSVNVHAEVAEDFGVKAGVGAIRPPAGGDDPDPRPFLMSEIMVFVETPRQSRWYKIGGAVAPMSLQHRAITAKTDLYQPEIHILCAVAQVIDHDLHHSGRLAVSDGLCIGDIKNACLGIQGGSNATALLHHLYEVGHVLRKDSKIIFETSGIQAVHQPRHWTPWTRRERRAGRQVTNEEFSVGMSA